MSKKLRVRLMLSVTFAAVLFVLGMQVYIDDPATWHMTLQKPSEGDQVGLGFSTNTYFRGVPLPMMQNMGTGFGNTHQWLAHFILADVIIDFVVVFFVVWLIQAVFFRDTEQANTEQKTH